MNTLSDEMSLGGSIAMEIRQDLNHLEGKIRPFLILKEYLQRLLDDVALVIAQKAYVTDEQKGLNVNFGKPYYEVWAGNEYLWLKVGGAPVELGIGPVSNMTGTEGYLIGFFLEFYSHREFQKYRSAQKGFRKDFLGWINWNPAMAKVLPSFHDQKSFAEWVQNYAAPGTENLGTQIGRMLVQFSKQWQHEGRGIDSIIEECLPPKAATQVMPNHFSNKNNKKAQKDFL